MAHITLNKVCVSFPVYNVNARSFKKSFLRIATGGNIAHDAKNHVLVNALEDLTLTLEDGDRIGLMGHNGSGKSTFLRLLAQIYEPTSGSIAVNGQISPILDIMHGIETEFTGVENILSRAAILGLPKKHIAEKINEIAEESGLGDYIHMPLRTFSSGMMVRLAFAISTCIRPDILLMDEIFGAGDADFMQKARRKMQHLLAQSSIVVLATHADDLLREFCNKALLLESGRIKFFGNIDDAFQQYRA